MKKTLARGVGALSSAALLSLLFGTGSASAVNEYEGMTYAQAANALGRAPIVATKVGSFLPTNQCVVTGSRSASRLDSSGNNRGGVLVDLNCNYMFALPGVPGNSLGSPEGRAARTQAEAQLAQQQAQAKAAAEAAAAEGAADGG